MSDHAEELKGDVSESTIEEQIAHVEEVATVAVVDLDVEVVEVVATPDYEKGDVQVIVTGPNDARSTSNMSLVLAAVLAETDVAVTVAFQPEG